MFLVELVCSEQSCEFTLETLGELLELEALVCECGCCLQIVSISEVEAVEARRPLEARRPFELRRPGQARRPLEVRRPVELLGSG